MQKFLVIARRLLLSTLVVLAVGQVPNRRFFLSRIWFASPQATDTVGGAGTFSLQRIQPAVSRLHLTVEKPSEVWTLVPVDLLQRDPAIVSIPLEFLVHAFQPTLVLSSPSSGRSPPLNIH